MKQLAHGTVKFKDTLFGWVNLNKAALGKGSHGIYWPAMVLVIGSAVTQYFQSKQLMPTSKDSRSLRSILKQAGTGEKADQSEVNAAVGRGTRYLLPFMIFIITVSYPSALSLYWLLGGLVAFLQQSYILREDTKEMEAVGGSNLKSTKDPSAIQEAEVVETKSLASTVSEKQNSKKKPVARKKRRKR
jgi:membrane protein insertase Oxa1/YidC/SpoIIIJ